MYLTKRPGYGKGRTLVSAEIDLLTSAAFKPQTSGFKRKGTIMKVKTRIRGGLVDVRGGGSGGGGGRCG